MIDIQLIKKSIEKVLNENPEKKEIFIRAYQLLMLEITLQLIDELK